MVALNETLDRVTDRVRERSKNWRDRYVLQMREAGSDGPHRAHVSCGNLAHAAAAVPASDKKSLAGNVNPNIGIVTAYNDMLSAHQPLGAYPDIIKDAVGKLGATAQIAGGVPAMCDGVTQGQPGMDLSLFSRDVIALATAVSLSHSVFDGAILLGTCDKIVPGLFIGAARFGHLPTMFLPAGPMRSGLPNDEKARVRQLYAEGKVGRDELLKAESDSYHSPGTCTFYGTANSNQMMLEMMGLHLPGSAFINPGTKLRDEIVRGTAKQIVSTTQLGDNYIPFFEVIDERAILNALVGLHATGGSTNHTIHLIAMARAVGVVIDWDDFEALSEVTPLLTRIYPNGPADVNHFHAAGGLAFIIRELLNVGLLHGDVKTSMGEGLDRFAQEPFLDGETISWRSPPQTSEDTKVLRGMDEPMAETGGLVLLKGNVGRSVIKVSAVKDEHMVVEAPAIVFHSQQALMDSFKAGELQRDFVAVIPFQGPKANGMPELHKLTPPLGALQAQGFNVALVTDGRMSGASGKVPAAIHLTPEALDGGAIAKIKTGDLIRLDCRERVLEVSTEDRLEEREAAHPDLDTDRWGTGRELFAGMRSLVGPAEGGAMTFALEEQGMPSDG
ncbi:MAG: phosphogluconate dehydratase [Pseudomonadota bacterium]